jgi:hypothetical protein
VNVRDAVVNVEVDRVKVSRDRGQQRRARGNVTIADVHGQVGSVDASVEDGTVASR